MKLACWLLSVPASVSGQLDSSRHTVSLATYIGLQPPAKVTDQSGSSCDIHPLPSVSFGADVSYRYFFDPGRRHAVGGIVQLGWFTPKVDVWVPSDTTGSGPDNGAIGYRMSWGLIGLVRSWKLCYSSRVPLWSRNTLMTTASVGLSEMTTTFAFGPIISDTTYIGSVDMEFASGSSTISYQLGLGISILRDLGPGHSLMLGLDLTLSEPGISGGYSIFPGTDRECTGRFIGSFSKAALQVGYVWRIGR